MDLISVIIPYYKKRNFIKETIISVINQSYDYLEILIIYDDINLNDLEFLQEISKLDKELDKKISDSANIINKNRQEALKDIDKKIMEVTKMIINKLSSICIFLLKNCIINQKTKSLPFFTWGAGMLALAFSWFILL